MSEPWCDYSDLAVAVCAHCKGVDLEDAPQETFGSTVAKFGGTLACGHRATKGQAIYVTDEGEWICGRCSKNH